MKLRLRRAPVRLCAALALAALPFLTGVSAATVEPAAESPTREAVLALGKRVADWQLARVGRFSEGTPRDPETPNPRGWVQGAFWVGMTGFAETTGLPRYREAVLAQGRAKQWRLGDRPYLADDHVIGQSYLWAARHGAGRQALAPMRKLFDGIIADRAIVHLSFYIGPGGYNAVECLKRWCWCDALFMSPATLIGLSQQTGDPRYADFAFAEFWATTDFLYDPQERLFYRDSRFFAMRDEKERKVFWSRGNGWVFAGIANILTVLPMGDPNRPRLERLFVDMAGKLKTLQRADGYWPPSLLAAEGSPPESSGTGFFTYGLAWGVDNGLLAAAGYEPAIRKGWAALARAVATDGRLGWVQQIGDRPENVAESHTQHYGVGAFLLAASAVAGLDLAS